MSIPGNLNSLLLMSTSITPKVGYRYWRLLLSQPSYVATAEVEFRTVATGATVVNQPCTGGVAIASSYYYPFVPSAAFDGVITGRGWASNGAPTPQWIGYDFGPTNRKHVVEVAIAGCDTPSQNITQANIQYSTDAVTWITVYATPPNLVLSATAFKVYSIPY